MIANGGGARGPDRPTCSTPAAIRGHQRGRDDDAVDGCRDDPHIWQDPTRVIATVRELIGPPLGPPDSMPTPWATAPTATRRSCWQLDAEITELLAPIPPRTASSSPATTRSTTSPTVWHRDRRHRDSVDQHAGRVERRRSGDIGRPDRRTRRATIFTEQLESTNDAEALADRLGVRVVPLVTDALTADPDSDTYIEMMRSNVTAIAEALAP